MMGVHLHLLACIHCVAHHSRRFTAACMNSCELEAPHLRLRKWPSLKGPHSGNLCCTLMSSVTT